MTWQPAQLGAISVVDGVVVVEHGGDGDFIRPPAGIVHWKGTIAPNNALPGDLWYDTTGDA